MCELKICIIGLKKSERTEAKKLEEKSNSESGNSVRSSCLLYTSDAADE